MSNSECWEKSWSITRLDTSPGDLGISASGDTLIMVGSSSQALYFLSANNPDAVLGSVLLDQSTTGTPAPNKLTGCTYLLDFKGNYRILVADRNNYYFYEVDPIEMKYLDKHKAPDPLAKPNMLRGLDYDPKSNAMTICLTCFDQTATELDSSLIAEVNQNYNFAFRTDLDGSRGKWGGERVIFAQLLPMIQLARGILQRVCVSMGIFVVLLIMRLSRVVCMKCIMEQASESANDPGYTPACIYHYGGFYGRGNVASTRDAPAQLCHQYWLRGLDFDSNSDAMTICVSCFNEVLLQQWYSCMHSLRLILLSFKFRSGSGWLLGVNMVVV